jgi:hypothetical protein
MTKAMLESSGPTKDEIEDAYVFLEDCDTFCGTCDSPDHSAFVRCGNYALPLTNINLWKIKQAIPELFVTMHPDMKEHIVETLEEC